MEHKERILIVDDMAKNRDVLHDMMLVLGYSPLLAENGAIALERIREEPPDVVLLDIMMPEMDGYEVLNHLKSDASLLDLPVIMISAVDEVDSVVKCIEQGAEDYLTKPFNPSLLKARLDACLDKKRLREQEKVYQKMIEDQNLMLEERVVQQSGELEDAYKKLELLNRTKNDFLNLISHELRTPLKGVLVAAEILSKDSLAQDARKKFYANFTASRARLLSILDDALLLTRLEVSEESFPMEPTSLQLVMDSAIEAAARVAEARNIRIGAMPDCDALVHGEKELLIKALVELLKTAVKFAAPEYGVSVSFTPGPNEIALGIRAIGRTIPEKSLPKMFSTARMITSSGTIGLGPAVAERIVSFFDGSVTVKNLDPPGILFGVKLKSAHVAASKGGFLVSAH